MKMWIARATNNVLTLHQFEPEKVRMDEESDDYFWASDIETISFLNRSLFPELTIENSPIEAELKFVKKKMMKTHKWKSRDLWLLPSLRVSKDSIDVTISIGWWKWHIEFISPNKGNNSFRGYEV